MFGVVGTGKHQYELKMNGHIVGCVFVCVGIVEMKNDAIKNDVQYERAAPTLCVVM
jgi:hypothetical protein